MVAFQFLPAAVFSQTYSHQTEQIDGFYSIDDTAAREFVQAVVATLPEQQQAVVETVEIIWTDAAFNKMPVATIYPDGKRTVEISQTYSHFLYQYVWILHIADVVEDPYLPESWLEAAAIRLNGQVDWQNSDVLETMSPISYARLHPDDVDRLLVELGATVGVVYQSALVDIILHELGHHATDSFYGNDGSSLTEARRAEKLADDWASDAVKKWSELSFGNTDYSSTLGRIFALSYSFEALSLRSIFGVENIQIATLRRRIESHSFANMCSLGLLSKGVEIFCNSVEKILDFQFLVPRTRDYYLERAATGESHALSKLGYFSRFSGDDSGACDYFFQAADGTSPDSVLWLYLADCNERNVFHLSPQTSRRNAAAAYCSASRNGWLDARARIPSFLDILGSDTICE